MDSNTTTVIGFIFGGVFLLLALFSTISKITLVVFSPFLLRQVAYRERPRTFVSVVCFYWLLGLCGLGAAIATVAGK